jgi:hypothetical protein
MRKAGSIVRRFGAAVKKVTAFIGILSGAVIAFAGAGIALLVRKSFQLNDLLGKTADKLGIATESLAGLQLATQITGTDVGQFTKGLENMARNVSDASMGIGEAKDALALLGVDAGKLVKMNLDRMFLVIAGSVGKLNDQASKIGAFRDIFGRPGASLLNMAALGRDRLRELMEFAVKAGVALSRFDVSMIEAANDAVLKTKTAVMGLINQLSVALAPIVKKIADMVTKFLVGIDKGRLRGFFVDMFEFGVVAAGEFLKLLGRIPEVFHGLKAEILEFGHLVRKAFDPDVEVKGLFSAHNVVAAQFAASLAKTKRTIRDAAIDMGVEGLFERLGLVRKEGGARSGMAIIADLFKERRKGVFEAAGEVFNLKRFKPFIDAFVQQVVNPLLKGGHELSQSVARAPIGPRIAGEFRQISPTRFFIPGLTSMRTREQRVRDPQLVSVVDHLRQIRDNTRNNVAVTS